MGSKYLKILLFAIAIAVTESCDPPEQFCNDIGRYASLDNYYSVVPLQTIYQKGDVVFFKLEIPSTNNFFGTTINIYGETGDEKPWVAGDDDLYLGNEILFQKGEQGPYPNQFYMEYINGTYYLEFSVELNRTGNYVFGTELRIYFKGEGVCNFYDIDAYMINSGTDHDITFEVVE